MLVERVLEPGDGEARHPSAGGQEHGGRVGGVEAGEPTRHRHGVGRSGTVVGEELPSAQPGPPFVVVDPSHGAGRRDLVLPLGRAALAAGAAGVMIETHDDPARALRDGPQAVPLADLPALVRRMIGGAS